MIYNYSHCVDILLACDISTMRHFASSLEHYQCFPREDVFLILALGSVRGNTVPRAVFLRTLPRAQGVYWISWYLWLISSDINSVDSEYQEIHTYSALNIDSVKINTSLLMMREWSVLYSQGVGLSCCDMEYRQIVQWLQHNLEHKNGMCGVTYWFAAGTRSLGTCTQTSAPAHWPFQPVST